MRGKKPKKRNLYVLRMADGTLVEVTREVYLEWHQSRRRERYQDERSRKHGICSLNEMEERGNNSGNVVDVREGIEETVLRDLFRDKVREVLKSLDRKSVV